MAHQPPDATPRLLGLIGLGVRGGGVSIGVDGTRALLQRRECLLVIVASDATQRVQDKVVRLAKGIGVTVVEGPSADALGERLGRPATMVVGVQDRALAAGILAVTATRDRT